jgi:hypothetical protein
MFVAIAVPELMRYRQLKECEHLARYPRQRARCLGTTHRLRQRTPKTYLITVGTAILSRASKMLALQNCTRITEGNAIT